MTVELTKSFLNDCSLATLPVVDVSHWPSVLIPAPSLVQLCHLCVIMAVQLYRIWRYIEWKNKPLPPLIFPCNSLSKIVLGSLFQETLETCRNIVPPATKLLQTFAIPRHNNDNKIGHYKVGNWFGAKFVRFRHLSRPFLAICDCIFQNIGE